VRHAAIGLFLAASVDAQAALSFVPGSITLWGQVSF
jgi:hypothetical protein